MAAAGIIGPHGQPLPPYYIPVDGKNVINPETSNIMKQALIERLTDNFSSKRLIPSTMPAATCLAFNPMEGVPVILQPFKEAIMAEANKYMLQVYEQVAIVACKALADPRNEEIWNLYLTNLPLTPPKPPEEKPNKRVESVKGKEDAQKAPEVTPTPIGPDGFALAEQKPNEIFNSLNSLLKTLSYIYAKPGMMKPIITREEFNSSFETLAFLDGLISADKDLMEFMKRIKSRPLTYSSADYVFQPTCTFLSYFDFALPFYRALQNPGEIDVNQLLQSLNLPPIPKDIEETSALVNAYLNHYITQQNRKTAEVKNLPILANKTFELIKKLFPQIKEEALKAVEAVKEQSLYEAACGRSIYWKDRTKDLLDKGANKPGGNYLLGAPYAVFSVVPWAFSALAAPGAKPGANPADGQSATPPRPKDGNGDQAAGAPAPAAAAAALPPPNERPAEAQK